MKRPWIVFFSQTGTEIADLINFFNVRPACIITNKKSISDANPALQEEISSGRCKLIQLPQSPSVADYLNVLKEFKNPIITLHGYLRIVPKEICEKYEIYNLHPGLITEYPDLKGKDPQLRAFKNKYDIVGCVLHKVVPEVDSGEIVDSHRIFAKGYDYERLLVELRSIATILWRRFLTPYVN
ncbi:hypothetical protein EBZ39_00720 [bacterium]|nr:hypothetical protein [bacterium]